MCFPSPGSSTFNLLVQAYHGATGSQFFGFGGAKTGHSSSPAISQALIGRFGSETEH